MSVLTIAIPTYNRLKWLRQSLLSIVEQIQTVAPNDVELLVSDNASSDGTWEFLQSKARQYPFLRLHRNPHNIGGEANFYLLPQLARGRYLYMIGDDDILEPGALPLILHELESCPDYLVLNFDTYDPTLQNCIIQNQLGVTEDRILSSATECLSVVCTTNMAFISIWVAKKEFFNLISAEKFHHFAQWGMSLQADRYFGIATYPRGKLLAKICLRNRWDDSATFDAFEWFVHGGVLTMRYAVESGIISRRTERKLRRGLLIRTVLRRICHERRGGHFNRQKYLPMLRADFHDLSAFWFLCVPTIFFPYLGRILTFVRWGLRRG